MRQSRVVLYVGVLALALLTSPILGQEKVGGLNGIAYDSTGAVLPNVMVTLTNKATNRVVSATTRADGAYFIRNVEPGRYSVKFELRGFALTEFPDINILVGQTFKLDSKMEVGGVETRIEVTDVVPQIDRQSTLVTHNLPAEEFNRIPKDRGFQSLAITAPAVQTGDIEGGIQVNGASGSENLFYVDGVPVNSLINGHSRQTAIFEYLQEVQVKTAGIDAEYGGALGGVITGVSTSGGNAFHGGGHFYFGGSSLSAGPVKRLNLDPRDDRTVNLIQDEEDAVRVFEPGFVLGGPIKKNMLYFFTAWSPRWSREDRLYRFANGTANDTLERDQTYYSGFNKISFDPTQRIRSNFTWLWTPTQSMGAFPGFNSAGPNWDSRSVASQQANRTLGFFQPQSNYSGSLDFVLNNNIMLSSRGSYSWDNYKSLGVSGLSPVEYATSAVGVPGVPGPLQQGQGFTNTPRVIAVRHDLTTRAFGDGMIAITGNAAGLHNLKAGYSLLKSVNNVSRSYGGGGYVRVFWDRTYGESPTGIQDRGQYGYYSVHEVGTIGSAGAGIKSFYVQDQWNIHPRLTLNIGIRAEQERIPSFRRDIQDFAFEFGWGKKIAPRIGASLDLRGDGKVKVYGSFGRYFDWTKYDLARGFFGADVQRTWYRSLETTDVFSLSFTNRPGRDLFRRTGDSFLDDRIPSFGPEMIDPDLKPMAQDQYVFGMDYQLDNHTVVGVTYLHNHLIRAIEDLGTIVNGNPVFIIGNPGEGLAKRIGRTSTSTPLFDYPKAVRNFDAVEWTLNRRLSNGWFASANYTWSRLYGNYAGIANSDEILTPATGLGNATTQQQRSSVFRFGDNRSTAWDGDDLLFDSKGNLDVKGRLATDRPHVLKLNGYYEKTWGGIGSTDVGAFFYLGSGTPVSTTVNTTQRHRVFVNGRGDLGRTPMLNYTDLLIGHNINLTEEQKLRIELNILNVFNQQAARHKYDNMNRGIAGTRASSTINLTSVNLFSGYNYNERILATPDGVNAFDPRYGRPDLFNTGLVARLGVKWTF